MISAPAAPLVCPGMIAAVTVQCVFLNATYPQDVPPVWLDSLEVTVNLVSDWCFSVRVYALVESLLPFLYNCDDRGGPIVTLINI